MNQRSLPSTLTIVVFLVTFVLIALFFPRSRSAVVGVVLALLTLGMSFIQIADRQLLVSQVSKDMSVVVRIAGVPDQHKGRLAFIADVISCNSCEQTLSVKRIRLSWYGGFPKIRAGEVWQLKVRLKPPVSLRNGPGFDAVAWALVKGLDAKGYVRDADSAHRISEGAAFSLSSLRQDAAEKLVALAGDNLPLGLLQALTVGVKTNITSEQWSLLRNTGTAHLVAISGLHVGLVAAWVLLFGKRFASMCGQTVHSLSSGRLSFDPRPWVFAAALSAAAAYAGLAGFELPTQRAVLMLSVWVVAALRFRFLPPMAALCVALVVVLSMNALSLLSAGFWLSFGTVATLFYLHSGHQTQAPDADAARWAAIWNKTLALGRTHVLLGVVLLPVTAWFFQTGSLVAPLANLIAVPWVGIVCVPLSLLGLLASLFSDTAAQLLLYLAGESLQFLMDMLQFLHLSTLSSVVLTLPGVLAFCLVLLGMMILTAPRGLRLRWLALPLFLPALLHNSTVPAADGFEIHVLDVGQGLAVLVYAGEQTLLFDTGGKVSPELSMFEAVVVPFLHATGRRRVDTLVVSHGDEDHAFGLPDVVRRYPDVRVYSSRLADSKHNQTASLCKAGTHWSQGDVQFAFIHPADSDEGNDNDRSCVLMVFMGKSRVLLTGDIELAAEQQLVSRLDALQLSPVTLLTAPHHGSNTSSSQSFVDKMRPDYVVFSAGHRNRYGFPHRAVQLRYKLIGSKSFTTGKTGAVSFVLGSEGLSLPPISWWDSRRRFWHGIVNPDCWQYFAGQSLVLRLLSLSQKGQTLCGK